ncbi:MAG: transposase, partial [Synergistaceae bacterium]|nr:transposase [Synergistaceae bacterium]
MPRKSSNPEVIARRERRQKLTSLLQELKVNSVDDIHSLYKEMIGTVLTSGLEGELDSELGYTKYDYRNKTTDNSRNGHSNKTLRTSFGEIDIEVPRDRKGEFDPVLVKK